MSNGVVSSIAQIDSMLFGLSESNRKRWRLCMLQCAVDDSGSDNQGDSRVFVLAGYISDEDRWKDFSKEWSTALNHGYRSLEYFKMVEAHSQKNQFDGWPDSERDAKLIELNEIIQKYVLFDVRAILQWKDHEDVQRQYPQYPVSKYEILFNCLMIQAILGVKNLRVDDVIDFYFDDQNKIGDAALKEYRRQQLTFPQSLVRYVAGPPSFKDEKKVLPLQAADLLAWQVRRAIYEEEYPERRTPRQRMPCLESVPSRQCILDKPWLQDFYESIGPWMSGD